MRGYIDIANYGLKTELKTELNDAVVELIRINTKPLTETEISKAKIVCIGKTVERLNTHYAVIKDINWKSSSTYKFRLLNSNGLIHGEYSSCRALCNDDSMIMCYDCNSKLVFITKDFIINTNLFCIRYYKDSNELLMITCSNFKQYIINNKGEMLALKTEVEGINLKYIGFNQYAVIKSNSGYFSEYDSMDIIDDNLNYIKTNIEYAKECLKDYGISDIDDIFKIRDRQVLINRPIR